MFLRAFKPFSRFAGNVGAPQHPVQVAMHDPSFLRITLQATAIPMQFTISNLRIVPTCVPKASLDGQEARQRQARRLRVIYFYWVRGLEFWLFTLYDKNELSDLSKKDRATLESHLKIELMARM
jgi:hypothetical protein